jgi:K+-transporting ATPase ATPase C chain
MLKYLYQSLMATLFLAILCCGIYPLLVTGVGKLVFPGSANGSILNDPHGKPVGSRLIGQAFAKPEHFHGRPSAAGNGYDAASSSGSNLGPTNQKLADGLKANIEGFLKENPSVKKGEVPADLVTASASGLDPHITPGGALAQAPRVAQARKRSIEELTKIIAEHTEGPQWGLLGESTVNVLELNLALDKLAVKN